MYISKTKIEDFFGMVEAYGEKRNQYIHLCKEEHFLIIKPRRNKKDNVQLRWVRQLKPLVEQHLIDMATEQYEKYGFRMPNLNGWRNCNKSVPAALSFLAQKVPTSEG